MAHKEDVAVIGLAVARDLLEQEICRLTVEAETLRAQNESLRKRLDTQDKLDRATAHIAEMARERVGMLTPKQAQAVRDVAAAKRINSQAGEYAALKERAEKAEANCEALHIDAVEAGRERDDAVARAVKAEAGCDKAVADAVHNADIAIGESRARQKAEKERDEWKAKAEAAADLRAKLDAVQKIVGRP